MSAGAALHSASLLAQATPAGQPTPELGARARVPAASEQPERARSTVSRAQMEERVVRSTPDALRFEPGVSVQQTAHGQASPYVRGMTGQQVLHEFDGVRMNNGVFRQGPNQYFFTVDSYTLERLEVVRGSASTRYGSDALGGAILALPREPLWAEPGEDVALHPALFGRFASADLERGGRAELELGLRDSALLGGAGYRVLDRLESGGVVSNPGRRVPLVPRFESDGRTQLGTGFRELTFDARAVQRVAPRLRVVAALYGFRQLDAPRTDQCPPPEAPASECLSVLEQFRTLAYASLRGEAGKAMSALDLNVSFQRHDELRVNDRPRSFVRTEYDNAVSTLGASFRARSAGLPLPGGGRYALRYGAEAYRDEVASSAAQELTDPRLRAALEPSALRNEYPRGQYLDGSLYVSSGLFTELELEPIEWLSVQAGGRLSAIGASLRDDPASGTGAASPRWTAVVGRAAATIHAHEMLRVQLGFDQGFRAPNLDDLSSRQQVGPGFQFENDALVPERTNSLELGVVATPAWLSVELWAFATWLEHGITRAVRSQTDCPESSDACRASRTQFQLVNAGAAAQILGGESIVSADLPGGVTLRANASYAWGEGPNMESEAVAGQTPFGERVPLSRIPPFNGSFEAGYRHEPTGLYGGAAVRWALAQRRLAPSDLRDPRIPDGGTPAYVVGDLRAGFRYSAHLRLSLVFENVLDAAYRVHGSSINGPGRSVLIGAALYD
jgi:outer membrane receptor protein involved in Fe transport